MKPLTLYLVTDGSGEDGDAWRVEAIFTTREGAEEFVRDNNAARPAWARIPPDNIGEWEADVPFVLPTPCSPPRSVAPAPP